jgi:hypothetical protein
MLPPKLARELEALGKRHPIEVIEDAGFINVVISDFPTGPLYNRPTTRVLLRVPRAYPDAGLDMFWTEVELTLANGSTPQCGDVIEVYIGRSWRRFSWHHNGWHPTLQDLQAYLEFVSRRFHAA